MSTTREMGSKIAIRDIVDRGFKIKTAQRIVRMAGPGLADRSILWAQEVWEKIRRKFALEEEKENPRVLAAEMSAAPGYRMARDNFDPRLLFENVEFSISELIDAMGQGCVQFRGKNARILKRHDCIPAKRKKAFNRMEISFAGSLYAEIRLPFASDNKEALKVIRGGLAALKELMRITPIHQAAA